MERPLGLELMPGGPEPPGPIPGPSGRLPIVIPPLSPKSPASSWLDGSPMADSSIWIVGESNATVMGIGNFGCGAVLGGMKVRCAVGGGAPCRAGSGVRLLPPECSGAARGVGHRSGAITDTTSRARGGDWMDRAVKKRIIPSAAACNPSDSACEFARRTKDLDAIQKPG